MATGEEQEQRIQRLERAVFFLLQSHATRDADGWQVACGVCGARESGYYDSRELVHTDDCLLAEMHAAVRVQEEK